MQRTRGEAVQFRCSSRTSISKALKVNLFSFGFCGAVNGPPPWGGGWWIRSTAGSDLPAVVSAAATVDFGGYRRWSARGYRRPRTRRLVCPNTLPTRTRIRWRTAGPPASAPAPQNSKSSQATVCVGSSNNDMASTSAFEMSMDRAWPSAGNSISTTPRRPRKQTLFRILSSASRFGVLFWPSRVEPETSVASLGLQGTRLKFSASAWSQFEPQRNSPAHAWFCKSITTRPTPSCRRSAKSISASAFRVSQRWTFRVVPCHGCDRDCFRLTSLCPRLTARRHRQCPARRQLPVVATVALRRSGIFNF